MRCILVANEINIMWMRYSLVVGETEMQPCGG
jgi:hypothetical protein